MKIRVANFLGVKNAEIEVNSFTVVGGGNYDGKTSLGNAAGAALIGQAMPHGLPKKDVEEIIHKGAKDGMVFVEKDASSVSISYPKCIVKTTGDNPPHASRIAVGFDKIMDMATKERFQFFTDFLESEPNLEQFLPTIMECEMSDKMINQLWVKIHSLSWDIVHDTAKDRGAQMKGMWVQCTKGGAPLLYGKNKAEAWYPVGWDDNLINADIRELENDVRDQEKFIEVALKETAVSESEIAKMTELKLALPKLTKEQIEKARKVIELGAQLNIKEENAKRLSPQEESQDCPYCKQPLIIINGMIEEYKGEQISEAQKKKIAAELKEINKEINELRAKINEAKAESSKVEILLDQAKAAAKQLDEIDSTAKDVQSEVDIGSAKERLEKARLRLDAFEKKQEADKIHASIIKQMVLVKALSPEGIRMKVLNEAISKFNVEIRELSAPTGWKSIQFDSDLNLMYGDRHYVLCSASEKLWINTAFQLFVAKKDGSDLVIVDNFDTFMKQERTWTIQAILDSKVPALVLMSMSKRELPDLSKIGGSAYWIEDGKIK